MPLIFGTAPSAHEAMNNLLTQYTLVRVLPRSDAGEFANIGVVLACPQTHFLGFKLLENTARVSQFFPQITDPLLRQLCDELAAELDHVKQAALRDATTASITRVMQDLSRPLESLVQYSTLRACVTDDPQAELDALFARYVG